MPITLPRLIDEKFEDLAAQVRRLRLYRGVSRVVLVGLLAALAALLFDRAFNLNPGGRWSLWLAWFLIVFLAAWRFVVRPRFEILTHEALAAAIETQFPSLSERLLTVVELSRAADGGHGSKGFIDLLLRETAQRTKRLDFERAAPRGPVFRLVLAAGALLGVGLAAMLALSGGAERVQRLLFPWHTPKIEQPFAIKVSSGSVVIKRGESVTLTAYAVWLRPDAVLPTSAVLVAKDKAGTLKKFPMPADEQLAFQITRPAVTDDFDYRVEAGLAASEWFSVAVADAVEIAEGTAIAILPPAYAEPPLAKVSLPSFAPISALQHSQLQFAFAFNRPATSASLEWLSTAANSTVAAERVPLSLAADQKSATSTTSLLANGSYRLTLIGDRGVATALSIPATAVLDLPPRFEKAVGLSERPRDVRPGEAIILELAVVDDFKVAALTLEFAVNGGRAESRPVPLKNLGTPRAEGTHIFKLAGLVKEGDVLTYRLKATDNRLVPAAGLTPQSVYCPEAGWATLKISMAAESLDRQDILAQKDAIAKKLEDAAAKAAEARQEAERVRRETGEKPMLSVEQVARRQAARDAAQAAAEKLDAAAKEAALTPELRGLADAMRGTADGLKTADEQLRRSENEPAVKARNEQFDEAGKQLAEARERIDKLKVENEALARNRLDKRRLEKLADDVNQLAAAAEKANDPAKKEKLLNELQRAKDELREIVNGNEALRKGSENAVNEQARKLAEEAAKLKAEQAALDEEFAKSEAAARKKALAESAAKQRELNAKADAMRKQRPEEPLAKAPFDEAKSKLEAGDAVGAMTGQEKAARELERFAEAVEKAANERRDAKAAAKQLAKLQDDLREEKPLDAAEKARRQEAIRAAAEKLSAPPGDSSANEKADALAKLKAAEKADPASADAAQKDAAEALRKLADKLPPREQRMKQALNELEKLQREQEALQRDADEKLKPFEAKKPDAAVQAQVARKLAEAAKKQAELAEMLGKIDAPGFEARRDRAAESARQAAEDLREGRPQDVPASQNDLKKNLAQLRTALDGGTPADAAADDLSRKQSRLADHLEKGTPDAAALRELQELQREISEGVGNLPDPGGAERLTRAKQAVQAAAKQFKKAEDVDELRKKARQAAQELNDLADNLAGVESDRERIERLAKERREQAERSQANLGKSLPPEQVAAAQADLEKTAQDLKQTRAGPAQEEKKKAVDAVEKLRRTPNAERAPGLQKAAAQALEDLAKAMPQGPHGSRPGPEGDASGDAGGQLPSKAQAAEARDLADQQRALRDGASKAAGGAKPEGAEAREKNQQELAEKAGKLAQGMDAASHAPTNTEANAGQLTQGAEAANEAKAQMEKAAREQKADRGSSSAAARQAAGEALAKAGQQAQAAAGKAIGGDAKAAAASQAADEANKLMRDAGQAEPGAKLKQAAGKISDAADRLGEVGHSAQPGKPANDGTGPKPLTTTELPADLQQYAGKPWGDLPGDVRARIIQDLKAKYGEDYARSIKLYFEQVAER